MKADNSRNTFRPEQHYRDVLKQQGRVDVDADWNEQQAINLHRIETETLDVIGRTGAPLHAAGFAITAEGPNLRIGRGRFYVDGLLCENDDDRLDYGAQPHRWDGAAIGDELRIAKAATGIVYLDVWLRHITALNDPLIREIALGGPDTATRTQVVWQVRVLPIAFSPPDREQIAALEARRSELQTRLAGLLATGGDVTEIVRDLAETNRQLAELRSASSTGSLTCESVVPEWSRLTGPGSGRLNARTSPTPPTTDLCQLPPRAGYQRTENQLYRVEVHTGGPIGQATFKWSRDNGSVTTSVEAVSGQNITVGSTGPDDVLGFAANHWIELVDEANELAGTPGPLLQIEHVPSGSRILTMKTTPPAANRARNPIVRRWDQSGPTASAEGVAITGMWQPLEDGVEVQFSGESFQTGDYWLIPARVATGDVEWPPFETPNPAPQPQPRRGIEHHFARLAIVELDREAIKVTADCRKFFPPLTEIGAPTAPPAPSAPKAMHVKGTSWRNDAPLALAEFLERGLFIDFDRTVDPPSVTRKTLIVTLELPIVPDTGFEPAATNRELTPRLGVILFGEITVRENQVRWLPVRSSLQSLTSFFRGLQQVLGRVTLKGATIWANEEGRLIYLDGRALGQPARAANSEFRRTDLELPSGDGMRASDFESWFLLALPTALGGFTITPQNVRLIQRDNRLLFAAAEGAGDPVEVVGTLTLSAPATADLVIPLNAAENGEMVEIPASVQIAAGQLTVRFLIAPGRRPPDGAARVSITARAAGAELTAVLTIGRG